MSQTFKTTQKQNAKQFGKNGHAGRDASPLKRQTSGVNEIKLSTSPTTSAVIVLLLTWESATMDKGEQLPPAAPPPWNW